MTHKEALDALLRISSQLTDNGASATLGLRIYDLVASELGSDAANERAVQLKKETQ